MSSLEAGADDFAYQEPAEPKPLTPASPRELKRLIKDWRSGRATRNVLQAMGDAYVAVFGCGDDRRHGRQCDLEGAANDRAVHAALLSVGAGHPAVGSVRGHCRGRAGGQPAVRAGTGVGGRRVLAARCADLACQAAPLSAGRSRSWRHFSVALWSARWSRP